MSDVSARALRARFVLQTNDSSVTPVAKGSIVVDVPDSDRKGANVAVSGGGTRITFDHAFRGPTRPSVVVTAIEGAQSGDWADITDVDRTGFDAAPAFCSPCSRHSCSSCGLARSSPNRTRMRLPSGSSSSDLAVHADSHRRGLRSTSRSANAR